MLGSAIAGILSSTQYGALLPILVTIILSFIVTLLILFLLPESHITELDIEKK